MQYIIYNTDGSIAEFIAMESIQQGDDGTKKIFVSILDTDIGEYTCTAQFELPNGEITELSGIADQQEVSGIQRTGYTITLTQAETRLAGNLKVNLKLVNLQGGILCSYQGTYKINPTAYSPDDTLISQAQYNSFLQTLASFVSRTEAYSEFQEKLIAGDNITIENNVISATGGGGGGDAVWGSITGNIQDQTDLIEKFNDVAGDIADETSRAEQAEGQLEDRIDSIEDLIPAQATSQNKLADKDFVNSSIATNTAYFKGTYNVVSDLGLTIDATHEQIATALASEVSNPTNNDYVFVSFPDPTVPTEYTKFSRYKYNSETGTWAFEFDLNNSTFTAQQWASINSGITAEQIANFVDLTSAQVISGRKTVNVLDFVYDTSNPSSRTKFTIYNDNGYNSKILFGDYGFIFTANSVGSARDGQTDLGSPSYQWKDGYFSGNVYAQNTLNVINARDIVNNTLTQAQYDLITNGKPTRIVGTFGFYSDGIILSTQNDGTYIHCNITGHDSYGQATYGCFRITISTKFIQYISNYRVIISENGVQLQSLTHINGKTIPDYPTTNTSPQVLTIGANGGNLSWEDVSGGNTAEFTPTNVVFGRNPTSITITMDSADISDIATNKYDLITLKTASGIGYDLTLTRQAELATYGSTSVIFYSSIFNVNGAFATFRMGFSSAGAIALQTLMLESGNNVFPYATNSGTVLDYETINNISVSADTTFTLATAPANTYPEYKANITNTDTTNAITITLPSGTKIITNDSNITISSNTFTIPADSSVELNLQNGHCIVYNWGI